MSLGYALDMEVKYLNAKMNSLELRREVWTGYKNLGIIGTQIAFKA